MSKNETALASVRAAISALKDAEKALRLKPRSVRPPSAASQAKGGAARAAKLTPERRGEIAKAAAAARWSKAKIK